MEATSPIERAEGFILDAGDSEKLNRRALLAGAVFLLGGAVALSRFTSKAGDKGSQRPVLSAEQFSLLEQISETMIPTTDTAGAIGAGVPAFIRQMLTDWGSSESRADFTRVLEAIEQLAWSRFGMAFIELVPERRLAVVKEFDAGRIATRDRAYRRFKWLVLIGYYHSEVGATHELRFELVPGAWRACLPLAEVGRASAFYGN